VCLPPATLIFGAYLWQLCTSWITVHLQSSGSHFLENYREDKAFALVSEVEKSSPPKTEKMWIATGLGLCMIATQVNALIRVLFSLGLYMIVTQVNA